MAVAVAGAEVDHGVDAVEIGFGERLALKRPLRLLNEGSLGTPRLPNRRLGLLGRTGLFDTARRVPVLLGAEYGGREAASGTLDRGGDNDDPTATLLPTAAPAGGAGLRRPICTVPLEWPLG